MRVSVPPDLPKQPAFVIVHHTRKAKAHQGPPNDREILAGGALTKEVTVAALLELGSGKSSAYDAVKGGGRFDSVLTFEGDRISWAGISG